MKFHNQENQAKMLQNVEMKIHRVCDQMTLLHSKIESLQIRYQRTRHLPESPVTQSVSMQLNVLQGMYNTYYQYAAKETQKLMVLYTPGV